MRLEGEYRNAAVFPVGGIGAGCIGMDGAGHPAEWEIFNHAGKFLGNGFSHFSVRAESDGEVRSAKILQGELSTDLSGRFEGRDAIFHGFGWGPSMESLRGFPHFRECVMEGAFPAAEYFFSDPDFPAKGKLLVWSPFIPGESDLASLPVAVFEITLENTGAKAMEFACAGVLGNPWRNAESENCFRNGDGVSTILAKNNLPPSGTEYGEIALSTDAADVSFQEYWHRGEWREHLENYWHDWNTAGHLKNRKASGSPERGELNHGVLAAHFHLKPGEEKTIRFVISWYIPNRSNTWEAADFLKKEMAKNGIEGNLWKNYYTKLCRNAREAAGRIFGDYERIRKEVFLFREAIHGGSLPKAALEGAAENLAVLISPTCLRLEDGTFWGWEGVGPEQGSCQGSCQHVWNYAQALSLLFPDLERSMREAHWKYNLDGRGGFHFRLLLPLGIHAENDWFRPCADGTFGEMMKTYREWKISGDDSWMKALWPKLRKALEFVWSPENPDRWDPSESGLLSGRQHHTLDMELFGPSAWLEGHYLGALRAAAEMAVVCGETDFAEKCTNLFERGKVLAEETLFNGEYYIQKIDLHDKTLLDPFEGAEPYWDSEHGEIKYQIGTGCEIDMTLGQWYASLYGLGDILDPKRVKSSLNAVMRHNFKKNLRDFPNLWRIFALDGEAAAVICTWPDKSGKPVIPLPYHSEAMTGFEWAFASHLVLRGEPEKGTEVAEAIRNRYDGRKRNPWNEIECGSNYARSMASYAMLQVWSGFGYDMTRGKIVFHPVVPGDFRCFWSLGKIWGVYERTGKNEKIRILHGEASFREFGLARAKEILLNGKTVSGSWTEEGFFRPEESVLLRAEDEISTKNE